MGKKEEIVNKKKLRKEKEAYLKKLKKRKKVKSKVPQSVQQTIPYITDYEGGIFEIAKDKYSMMFQFDDINYIIAKQEEQESIFVRYGELLNTFSADMEVSVIINNKRIDKEDFKEKIMLPMRNDMLNKYREEYNEMLMKQVMAGKNEVVKENYILVSVEAKDVFEAKRVFDRVETEVIKAIQKMGSICKRLDTVERLEILHDFFRPESAGMLNKNNCFDYERIKKEKLSTKDFIAPESFTFSKNHFMIGDQYARAMFINNLPTYLSDRFLSELVDNPINMMTSIDIKPIAPEDALKLVKHQITGMEANKIEAQKKALRAGYDPEMINHNLRRSLDEAVELLDDLQNKNQKMFFVSIVFVHLADTKEKLENDTKLLSSIARKFLCQAQKLNFQQEDALKQVLPIGHDILPIHRTLTTESTSIFIPFASKELVQGEDSMYYGMNAISKNLILFNRKTLKNPNGFILGTPGSGKSFSAKREMVNVLLNTDDDVVIIDPEREYTALAQGFDGEVIHISAGSKSSINPLDMSADYADDDNPIILKSDFILSLCECLIGGRNGLSAVQRTIIDRCVNYVYLEYTQTYNEKNIPTLKDFYKIVANQPEPEAKELALALEIYTEGNLSVFSNKTNVTTNKRLVVYDIKDLGKSLKTMGMLIVLDTIWNTITKNRGRGKRTWFYIDEIYLLFSNEYSANFLFELYKRARKWGGIPTGITQNVEDLLKSDTARTMLSNSEFLLLLNQAYSDLEHLVSLLNLSETQASYVFNSEAGQGLIRAGVNVLPFIDKFPKDTDLYAMMTTNPDEIKALRKNMQNNTDSGNNDTSISEKDNEVDDEDYF